MKIENLFPRKAEVTKECLAADREDFNSCCGVQVLKNSLPSIEGLLYARWSNTTGCIYMENGDRIYLGTKEDVDMMKIKQTQSVTITHLYTLESGKKE